MKPLLITGLLATMVTAACNAQYYYKDIVSSKQSMEERTAIRAQKVRNILVHSFEGNGETSPGFFCEKKISKDYRRMETYTKSNITGKSLLTAYYNEKDQLVQSVDSSEISSATSTYQYDGKGNLTSVLSNSHSSDDDFSTRLIEEHQYVYDDKDRPVTMLRIRNQKDSALIIFTADEQGNITDENDKSKNGRHYYYYYNDKNRLTDIVKFDVVKEKLLPDLVFEYNTDGQVIKMVSVEEGVNSNYFTWRYIYNDGLRIIEKCFSRENRLLGYFEYEYK